MNTLAVAWPACRMSQGIDVLTMEIEHIDTEALEGAAATTNVDVEPTAGTIKIIQDKYQQKVSSGERGWGNG